jgi:phosphocarrier protein
MYTKQTIIKNISGLHARPASEFVALAKTFESKITIKKLETENAVAANAKSIIKVLAQGISVNTPVEISAEGPDETEAVDKILELIDSKFGED